MNNNNEHHRHLSSSSQTTFATSTITNCSSFDFNSSNLSSKDVKPVALEVISQSNKNCAVSDSFSNQIFGKTITETHSNYILMYNMLSGIRTAVSRCQSKPHREIESRDFRCVQKLHFEKSGNKKTPSSKYEFKFKDYAPWVFRHLRESSQIDAIDYLTSLTEKYVLSELYSPGKSGSLFYYSQDHKFIIKTIKESDSIQLRKILPYYFQHLAKYEDSLLVRFYGLHRLTMPKTPRIYFIVMANILPTQLRIDEIYDIKGATADRKTIKKENNDQRRLYIEKDCNWIENNRKLRMEPNHASFILRQTRIDCSFLSQLKIMDYSMLIGIHTATLPPVNKSYSDLLEDQISSKSHNFYRSRDFEHFRELYFLGVIDILTEYSTPKKIEHFFKSIRYYGSDFSTVEPDQYAERFVRFIMNFVLERQNLVDYDNLELPPLPN